MRLLNEGCVAGVRAEYPRRSTTYLITKSWERQACIASLPGDAKQMEIKMIKLNKNILLASVFAVAMGSFVGTAQAAEKDPKALMAALLEAQDALNNAADGGAKAKAKAQLGAAQAAFNDSLAGMNSDEQTKVKTILADQMKAMTKADAPATGKETDKKAAAEEKKAKKMKGEMEALEKDVKDAKTPEEAKEAQKKLDAFRADRVAEEKKMEEDAKAGIPGAGDKKDAAAPGAAQAAVGNGGMLPIEGASCNDDKVAGCEAGKAGCTYQKPAAPAATEAAKEVEAPSAEDAAAKKGPLEENQNEVPDGSM